MCGCLCPAQGYVGCVCATWHVPCCMCQRGEGKTIRRAVFDLDVFGRVQAKVMCAHVTNDKDGTCAHPASCMHRRGGGGGGKLGGPKGLRTGVSRQSVAPSSPLDCRPRGSEPPTRSCGCCPWTVRQRPRISFRPSSDWSCLAWSLPSAGRCWTGSSATSAASTAARCSLPPHWRPHLASPY